MLYHNNFNKGLQKLGAGGISPVLVCNSAREVEILCLAYTLYL